MAAPDDGESPVKSTHKTECVRVHLEPHPNADSLSVVKIWGFQVCVRTADWQEGALGAYVVPDSVVDTKRPEFAFLGDHKRIRVKKLRGVLSQGLLVPAPPYAIDGEDVAEILGVTRYEPPVAGDPGTPGFHPNSGGEATRGPAGWYPKYDVDAWHRYKHLFTSGEEVIATEKLHGASGRWCVREGITYCGSRTEWKTQTERNQWWLAFNACPAVRDFCNANQDLTVYGEVYGMVGGFPYGVPRGGVRIGVFDILRAGAWLPPLEARTLSPDLPWVPILYQGPYDEAKLLALAEKDTTMPGARHMSEGLVVKPMQERTCLEIGRVQLKLVSNRYYEKS